MTPRHLSLPLLLIAGMGVSACDDLRTYPTEPTATAESPEGSFSSQLLPGGSATRAFTMPAAGTMSLTLSATTPASVVLGLGVGIPQANGAGCLLNSMVETAAGSAPQITVTTESGTYCAKVYDVGNLTTTPVPFTLSFSRP
jgi:hypothetical protein